MLTEAEVQRSFLKLFKRDEVPVPDVFEKAEALLDELRPESPLRIRLEEHIKELRTLHAKKKK